MEYLGHHASSIHDTCYFLAFGLAFPLKSRLPSTNTKHGLSIPALFVYPLTEHPINEIVRSILSFHLSEIVVTFSELIKRLNS